MYTVIRYFEDLTDNNFPYNVGDTYPREGLAPTEERIKELASDYNKQHTPLIKAVELVTAEDSAEEEKPADKKAKRKQK